MAKKYPDLHMGPQPIAFNASEVMYVYSICM